MGFEPDPAQLTDNEQAVLAAIFSAVEATRADIVNAVGLSRPTVSIAVSALENSGLVEAVRSHQGPLGRSTMVYAIARSSGWIMGVSVESDCLRIVARGLNGGEIASVARPIAGDNDSALTAIRQETKRIVQDAVKINGPPRAVGIALERIIPRFLSRGSDPRTGLAKCDELVGALGMPDGVAILVENAANCAALAELTEGSQSVVDEFVYLHVGAKIGSGIVSEGRVLRGAFGGAGEVSSLPSSLLEFENDKGRLGPEHYLGAPQLLDRAARLWRIGKDGPAPATVKELSQQARLGSLPAAHALADESACIFRVALALAAVVDPGLLILDGEVGRDREVLRQVSELAAANWPDLKVRSGSFGDRATVEGAAAIALDHCLDGLIGHRQRRKLHARVISLHNVLKTEAAQVAPPRGKAVGQIAV